MKSLRSLLKNQCLLPIIQADSVENGIAITQAMHAAGIHLVEVVLRTEASLAALIEIKRHFPDMSVGAGTITDVQHLDSALNAGADFIVTPAVSPKLLSALCELDLPVLPGVSNTGDILMAKEFGFNELKFFPANLSGGYPFIKSLSSVFPDVSFCPTGGINHENRMDYLTLENCFAVGGSWVVKPTWVKTKAFEKITKSCLEGNAFTFAA